MLCLFWRDVFGDQLYTENCNTTWLYVWLTVKHANHKNSFYKYTFVYSVSLTARKYPSHFKDFKTKKKKTKKQKQKNDKKIDMVRKGEKHINNLNHRDMTGT